MKVTVFMSEVFGDVLIIYSAHTVCGHPGR